MAAKDEKEKLEVITAVYKVNLHCPQCAFQIKKPLLRTQGVQNVDVDIEKSEIKVKGAIEVIKIHKLIEKWSRRKVELISPKIKVQPPILPEKKVVKEVKEVSRTITMKVHMHCHQCEHDLRKHLLKHKGIYTVKTDIKTQILTIQGTIESDKLLSYIRRKVNKNAEIIPAVVTKSEKKEESITKKEKVEVTVEGKEKSTIKSTEMVEFKEETKVAATKTNDGAVPYFVHYVYAPQLFSDENPNACSIM
ncbi:heavy metal-associated isoprenylated plant protein 4 [Carica papaya]|uniref:heavy metal-associated isoprenylated plant protein 4 n=1 Tax=Carica papaya TaxID=3649 RepID=UPI000B8C838E|nr:heavy metal-associated isoprenylated plant protein 4 [Carica papaya]